jgi:hypothetical protein
MVSGTEEVMSNKMSKTSKLLKRAAALTLSTALAGFVVGSAAAHHSFAMFDSSKTVEVVGDVGEFEWINPHVWLHVKTADESGKEIEWSFEAGSPRQLEQSGWTRESVHPGDKITVAFHPLKDGSNGGQLLEISKADGTSLCQGAWCREKEALTN